MDIDCENTDILILGNGSAQGLDNTTLTAEAEYSIKFSRLQRKFCLSLHYNWSHIFFFLCVNATEVYQKITPYPLCLQKFYS